MVQLNIHITLLISSVVNIFCNLSGLRQLLGVTQFKLPLSGYRIITWSSRSHARLWVPHLWVTSAPIYGLRVPHLWVTCAPSMGYVCPIYGLRVLPSMGYECSHHGLWLWPRYIHHYIVPAYAQLRNS